MAEANPVSAPTAQVVGNAFVEQYYHILHHSPELVHRFYQDSSSLSRPDAKGTMTTVSTMQAINERILSLNYEEYTAEIKTADAQESHEEGVIVLVTGCLTGKDNIRKKFAQMFFLAPQDQGGFYVLNDVFRFVEESETSTVDEPVSANDVNESAQESSVATELEAVHAPDHLVVDHETPHEDDEDLNNGPEVCDPSDNDDKSVVEDEIVEPPTHLIEDRSLPIADLAPESLEDAPKQSYASILKVMKASKTPQRTVRPPSTNTDQVQVQQPSNFTKPAPIVEAPAPPVSTESAALENDNVHEVESFSIYVRNLPYDATVEQLDEEFKKFGPIKRDGVQVRSSKQQGFCFGFVEFESASGMQAALEASPITIGDRPAVIEEKRTSSRGGGGRGKYASGRGSFRSDSFRGRPNFGGRSYGRSDFKGPPGEFMGRGRGPSGRSGEGYQRQNGRGGGRQGGGGGRSSVAV